MNKLIQDCVVIMVKWALEDGVFLEDILAEVEYQYETMGEEYA